MYRRERDQTNSAPCRSCGEPPTVPQHPQLCCRCLLVQRAESTEQHRFQPPTTNLDGGRGSRRGRQSDCGQGEEQNQPRHILSQATLCEGQRGSYSPKQIHRHLCTKQVWHLCVCGPLENRALGPKRPRIVRTIESVGEQAVSISSHFTPSPTAIIWSSRVFRITFESHILLPSRMGSGSASGLFSAVAGTQAQSKSAHRMISQTSLFPHLSRG